MTLLASCLGLFFSAFLAATIFPAQSELVLVGLISRGALAVWVLVLIASIGNTLGSVLNWILGRGIVEFGGRKWFPVKVDNLARATEWYHRYGRWSLLLSWAPFIGDPLTVVAGVLREKFAIFLCLVATAKSARYIVLAYATVTMAD